MYACAENQPLATVSSFGRQSSTGPKRPLVTVRWPEPADSEAIDKLFASPQILSWTVELPGNPPARPQSQPSSSDEGYMLLACEDSSIVGAIYLGVCSTDQSRHTGFISSLIMSREPRSQEICRKLLKSTLYFADHWLHLKRLQLAVLTSSDTAIKVFGRFGFVEEGRLQDCALQSEDSVDVILMSRVKVDND